DPEGRALSFLHPAILATGLLAIAIPIIIHFIRRRRRPIEWAAMRFLQDALRKRRRRLRLEQLLLLLTRCAIVLLIALAIARPTTRLDEGTVPTTHILAIDNSIGSGTRSAGGDDLSVTIERALDIVSQAEASPGDTVAVMTLGSPGEWALWPPTADADAARRTLARITQTDSAATLTPLGDRDDLAADPENGNRPGTRTVLHVLSAWSTTGSADALRDPLTSASTDGISGIDQVVLHTSPAEEAGRSNIGLVGLSTSTPSLVGSATLAPMTRVSGSLVRSTPPGVPMAEQQVVIELIARPSGIIAGATTARFDPGQTRLDWSAAINQAALTQGRGGRITLVARLDVDDANPLDNQGEVVIARKRDLRAAVVERALVGVRASVTPGTWALAALSPDERAGVSAFRVDPVSLGSIPAASLDAAFILEPARVTPAGWARAGELLARGGLVAITPDADTGAGTDAVSWASALRDLSDGQIRINTDAGIRSASERLAREAPSGLLDSMRGEFAELVGAVGLSRRIDVIASPGAITPVRVDSSSGGDGPVFLAQTSARGTLVVFASPFDLSWTDLPARPIFVPIMQELVRRGSGLGIDNTILAGIDRSAFEPAPGIDRWTQDASISGDRRTEHAPGAHAGVWIGLGPDGQIEQTLTVRPDADAARFEPSASEDRASGAEVMFPGVPIVSETADRTRETQSVSASAQGDGIALTLLAACAALAGLESLIARIASHPGGGAA
ncbi:MAG: BatA domain-containing protein, partial [Planctomycetota bacterium]